jgi:hypothetical protein
MHMTSMMKATAGSLALAGLLAMSGCGGGSDDGGGGGGSAVVDGTDVPVGVEQNVDDTVAFAKRLIAQTSESSEPLVLGNAKVATSETAEPAEL